MSKNTNSSKFFKIRNMEFNKSSPKKGTLTKFRDMGFKKSSPKKGTLTKFRDMGIDQLSPKGKLTKFRDMGIDQLSPKGKLTKFRDMDFNQSTPIKNSFIKYNNTKKTNYYNFLSPSHRAGGRPYSSLENIIDSNDGWNTCDNISIYITNSIIYTYNNLSNIDKKRLSTIYNSINNTYNKTLPTTYNTVFPDDLCKIFLNSKVDLDTWDLICDEYITNKYLLKDFLDKILVINKDYKTLLKEKRALNKKLKKITKIHLLLKNNKQLTSLQKNQLQDENIFKIRLITIKNLLAV